MNWQPSPFQLNESILNKHTSTTDLNTRALNPRRLEAKPTLWQRLRNKARNSAQAHYDAAHAHQQNIDAATPEIRAAGAAFLAQAPFLPIAEVLHHTDLPQYNFIEDLPWWARTWPAYSLMFAAALLATWEAGFLVKLVVIFFLYRASMPLFSILASAARTTRLLDLYEPIPHVNYRFGHGGLTAYRIDQNNSAERCYGQTIDEPALGGRQPHITIFFHLRRGAPIELTPYFYAHLFEGEVFVSDSPCVVQEDYGGTRLSTESAARLRTLVMAQVERIEHRPKMVTSTVDPEALQRAWSSVVLADDTLTALVTQQMLFMDDDPAGGRGLLLTGSPGTGKTTIARTFAENARAQFFLLSESDLKQSNIGASAQAVKQLWAQATSTQRAVIFIDECEGVFGRRGSDESDQVSSEIVRSLLPLWDGLSRDSHVLIVGATNRAELLDPAIRSRFGVAIEIALPGPVERAQLLHQALAKMELPTSLASESALSAASNGLSGRDLDSLAMTLRRAAVTMGEQPTVESALKAIYEMRGELGAPSNERARWDTLIAAPAVVEAMKDLAYAVTRHDTLAAQGYKLPRGYLFYGPPGTGKTQIARTLATEAKCSFIAASTADLKAGYVGQSGQRVKQLFADARAKAPCIVFLDELDALASAREGGSDQFVTEIVNQLLQELDGVDDHSSTPVVVIGATNRLEVIDSAIRSRFERPLLLDLPNEAQRAALVELLATQPPFSDAAKQQLAEHVRTTAGLSHRDIAQLVSRVMSFALRAARHAESSDPLSVAVEHVISATSEAT